MQHWLIRALSLLAVVVLFLSACGSGTADRVATNDDGVAASDAADTDGAGTGGSSVDGGAVASSASGDDGDDDTAESARDTPDSLEDYLGTAALALRGFGGGGGGGPLGGIDTEQITAEQQLIEIEVQTCMQAEGFEYTPEEVTGGLRLFAAAGRQGVSAEDYAATEGFGITTLFDEVFAGEVVLDDDEPSANDELLASMSEGEAEAWLFALRGEPPVRNEQGQVVDPDTGEVIPGGGRGQATGGCRLEAQIEVRGDLAQLGELTDAWEELEDRIAGDARIAEIERDWASCMLDRGFDYQNVDEARADFQSQFRPLMRSFVQQSFNAGDGAGSSTAQPGPGQGRGGAGGFIQALADQGLTDEQEAELRSVQDLEIAAAVASLECSGDTQAEIDEIEADYERRFIEENRALLEAFGS